MKDSELKDMLFKHHWAQRHYAQPEVEIYPPGGIAEGQRMITDVDVIALRPHPDLYFERLLGDCRTLRTQSPVNRALWLSGLMRLLGARSGVVLLKAEGGIEPDHKLVAQRVGIQLFSQTDFAVYDRAILYPGGSGGIGVSVQDLRELRQTNGKYDRLKGFLDYVYRDAWQEISYRSQIRRFLGELRQYSGEFDPAKVEHVALLCDAASVFAVGVADLAGRLFQQFLQPTTKDQMANSLRIYLWDGRTRYEFVEQVRQKLAEKVATAEVELPPLDLPEWNDFVQLARHLLDQPQAAFQVPWLLRQLAVDIFRSRKALAMASIRDVVPLKHSMLIVSYLCKATRLPRDFDATITGELVRIQADLTVGQQVPAPAQPQP